MLKFSLRAIIFSVRNFWEKETWRSLSLNIQHFYSSQFCPLLSLKTEFNELKQNWSTEPTRGFSTCTPWKQDSLAKAIVCQGILVKLCAFPLIFSFHFLSLFFPFPLPNFYIATFFSATKFSSHFLKSNLGWELFLLPSWNWIFSFPNKGFPKKLMYF